MNTDIGLQRFTPFERRLFFRTPPAPPASDFRSLHTLEPVKRHPRESPVGGLLALTLPQTGPDNTACDGDPAAVLAIPSLLVEHTIHVDGEGMEKMGNKIPDTRRRAADSEKITINLGYVDLGQVDLLVQEGFYSNRTDFIRTAIRNQLERHGEAVQQSIIRHQLELGLRHYHRAELEAAVAAHQVLHIQVLGLAVIDADIPPELARAAIGSLRVLGALQASPAVKAALKDRIH